ncbi:MAG TPA: hypothetical protein VNN77_03630 [candidate division Zixibacteria bacterium]|nr:hypothetical protein [candidate division Zixibacteria bacterium]
MKEAAQQVLDYLGGGWIPSLAIAFLAGWAGSKTVASEWRWSAAVALIVGSLGLFLGQFVLFFFGLQEYLEQLPSFRLLFDFIAAYVGSFVVAAVFNFVKPV